MPKTIFDSSAQAANAAGKANFVVPYLVHLKTRSRKMKCLWLQGSSVLIAPYQIAPYQIAPHHCTHLYRNYQKRRSKHRF